MSDDSNRTTGPAQAEANDEAWYQQKFFASSGGDTLEVAMLWGDQVLSVTSFRKPQTVTIGPDRKNDFVLGDNAFRRRASLPFVVSTELGYALVFTEEMSGSIQRGERGFTLSEAIDRKMASPTAEIAGGYQVALDARTSARVDIGALTLLVHFTELPPLPGGGFNVDTAPLPYVGISATAHLMFLALAVSLPEDVRDLDLDDAASANRFVEMVSTSDRDEDADPDWLDDSDGSEKTAKHRGEEGEAGDEDTEQDEGRMEIEGDAEDDLEVQQERDTEAARNTGVAAVFNSDQVSSEWGDSVRSVGSDARHALANLDGARRGPSTGSNGLGVRNSRTGGGGDLEGSIGLDEIDTVGPGGSGGSGDDGADFGRDEGDLGNPEEKIPETIAEDPAVEGSLDEEIIRRVVRQHRREIAYCYEKELQRNKTLEGRIKVQFTISGGGEVISARVTESSIESHAVESCVTSKIQRWVFPAPNNEGLVEVNYPFNFIRQ